MILLLSSFSKRPKEWNFSIICITSSLNILHLLCISLFVIQSGPGVLFGFISLKALVISYPSNGLSNLTISSSLSFRSKPYKTEKFDWITPDLNTSSKYFSVILIIAF
ncbi:hypothetical protein Scep_027546 [Stephania cephalantha]|uniref:Uncharacterized protein n=1 Tax=Stephania cephalantha TaxID=152367 RepID=A0AAP0EGK5_9MAGN